MSKLQSIKVTVAGMASAFSCLTASGQFNNVVFTEVNSTTLTETVNGIPIGGWGIAGPNSFDNFGGPNGTILSGVLDFSDPLNPGAYTVIAAGGVTEDVPAGLVTSANPGVGATDTLLYGVSGALVFTPGSPVPADITFQAAATPDQTTTGFLLLPACAALFAARKFFTARKNHGTN